MQYVFKPGKSKGILFLGGFSALLSFMEIRLIVLLSATELGMNYFLICLLILFLSAPLIFLLYRLYSLLFSSYTLDRQGLHIRWGKRRERIPLNMIEWVRRPEEMPYDIPWSVLPMPGAYLGTVPSEPYHQIEFLASDTSSMLFVGTPKAVYAISPRKPDSFLEGFRRILEIGTLEESSWKTYRPGNWIIESWNDPLGRRSIVLSGIMLLIIVLYIGFQYTTDKHILMQFSSAGRAKEVNDAETVLLVPLLAFVCCGLSFVFGGLLFGKEATKNTARLMWVFMVITTLLFLFSVILIF